LFRQERQRLYLRARAALINVLLGHRHQELGGVRQPQFVEAGLCAGEVLILRKFGGNTPESGLAIGLGWGPASLRTATSSRDQANQQEAQHDQC
jgi:hypothetical protein